MLLVIALEFEGTIFPVIFAVIIVARLSIQPKLFSRGTTASLPASPMIAVVGLSTTPPVASWGTVSVVNLLIEIPGIALMIPIARLIALINPFIILTAPLRTPLIAPFIAPLIVSPKVLNAVTIPFHTFVKNSPIFVNTPLTTSNTVSNMPVKKSITPLNTETIPSQIVCATVIIPLIIFATVSTISVTIPTAVLKNRITY